MAEIFPVHGRVVSESWGELPWLECAEIFELDESCRTEDLFPGKVVVRLDEPEAGQHNTKPGYFVSGLEGIIAKMRLDEARGA